MKKLFVSNLNYAATEDELVSWLGEWGVSAVKCTILRDRETQDSRGMGFVDVPDADFDKALGLTKKMFSGRQIRIAEAKRKESRNR